MGDSGETDWDRGIEVGVAAKRNSIVPAKVAEGSRYSCDSLGRRAGWPPGREQCGGELVLAEGGEAGV